MGECAPSQVVNDFVSRDSGRLYGEVGKAPIQKSPWLDTYPTGKLDNNMGNSFRVSLQERTVLAGSLVNPNFVADVSMCGVIPAADRAGSKEFTMQLGTFRGRSNKICVTQARTAFKTAYLRQQEAMKNGVVRIVNAEGRANALLFGGTKIVADSTATPGQALTGGELAIATAFNGSRSPDSAPTFKFIKNYLNLMRDTFHVEPFSAGNQPMWKAIFSTEQTDRFRDELDIKNDLRSAITGRYRIGEEYLTSFEYEGPYREVGFASDPQPLRAVAVNGGSGAVLSPNSAPYTTAWVPGYAPTDSSTLKLALVEPEIAVNSTNGVGSRANPDWVNAAYEIGFVMGDNSFTRLTPQTYTGEGDMRFSSMIGLETLKWRMIPDNDCNMYEDFGYFIYAVSRAYQPMHPEAIAAIIYKRCPATTGLTAC